MSTSGGKLAGTQKGVVLATMFMLFSMILLFAYLLVYAVVLSRPKVRQMEGT